jgi:hypothetical protein
MLPPPFGATERSDLRAGGNHNGFGKWLPPLCEVLAPTMAHAFADGWI